MAVEYDMREICDALAEVGANPLKKNREGYKAGNGISGQKIAVMSVWQAAKNLSDGGGPGGRGLGRRNSGI